MSGARRTSFKPGQARLPGSGRKKGTPNKKTQELLDIWEELQYCPARALATLMPELPPEKQADLHMKAMEFKFPKRKAVEHSGLDGAPIEFTAVSPIDLEERKRMFLKDSEPS